MCIYDADSGGVYDLSHVKTAQMIHGRNIYFHSHLQMDLTQNTESEFLLYFQYAESDFKSLFCSVVYKHCRFDSE